MMIDASDEVEYQPEFGHDEDDDDIPEYQTPSSLSLSSIDLLELPPTMGEVDISEDQITVITTTSSIDLPIPSLTATDDIS